MTAAKAGETNSAGDSANHLLPRFGHVRSVSKGVFHRIAYTDWGEPTSPRIAVCVHGLTRQGRDFDRLAMVLAGRGWRVICPDLAGRGQSDWLHDPYAYALPQYCVDMAVLLAKFGADRVDWIGTSLGGLIGIVMAGLGQTPIKRLVVNDMAPSLAWPALRRIGMYLGDLPRAFASLVEAERYFRRTLAPFGNLSDANWRHLTEHSIAENPDGSYRLRCDPATAQVFRSDLLWNLDLWKYWDAIECPVLVLRGEHSDLLLSSAARQMAERGPRATVTEISGVGHAPALMDRVQLEVVSQWLESSGPADEVRSPPQRSSHPQAADATRRLNRNALTASETPSGLLI